MKKISFLIASVLFSFCLQAQAPLKFSFQTVIRNSNNQLVVGQTVGIKISILQGNPNGSEVYAETHEPLTNSNGLATLEIGVGSLLSGSFADINWANGPYFLKTETDPNGGINYTITSTSQLLSVPYALYSSSSNTANTATTAGNGVPAGGTHGQVLTNCNGVLTWTTAGQCPEIIVSINCSSATNSGTLTQGVAAVGVSSNVPYTGIGGTYNGQTVNSSGVLGLTATLEAGTFANGAGVLTYTITGTPATSGTASFVLNIGGQTCTLTRTVDLPSGIITSLDCSTATNSGSLIQGTAASSVSSSVPYTGGNGGTYSAQTINSTGVTGLTATLSEGVFANGAGVLTYTFTGTPAASGTASFVLNIGGQTCTLTRNVSLPSGTIASLSCSTATNSGSLIQGIAAESVSSSIPYTGGNGGTYSAQTINSSGVLGLTATLAEGNFASGAGALTYTITGTPATSGTASFVLNIGGQTCTLTMNVAIPLGTIATLSCSTATNTGSLTDGITSAGVSSSVPYTGGNGGSYSAQTIPSTGVTGLTASLVAGNFANGAGNLNYTIIGTPGSSGTASFELSIGGQICTLSLIVNLSISDLLNIETVLIPAGTFTMGSPLNEPGRLTDELQHQVTLSAFEISKYETSNAQFAVYLNARNIGSNGEDALGAFPSQPLIYENPNYGLIWTGTQWQPVSGKENFPVTNVTWYGAREFATFAGGRLPTEAEFEYACRGNTTTPYSTGACLNDTQANYRWEWPLPGCSNANTAYLNETLPIDSYSPNSYGLYNMHGNVLEWCNDYYDDYSSLPQTNPTGSPVGPYRVLRGGGFANNGITCRSAKRSATGPVTGSDYFGFRLAFQP